MKDFEFADLFDAYGNLLTDLQRSLIEGYYLYDLSYTELAEEHGGSRQSVYDAIKKARAQLTEYEQNLKLVSLKRKINNFADSLDDNYHDIKDQLKDLLRG
ncbi:MAG: hypothetical protein J6B16_05960 [Clostridia bacterium]|nr:hypothetical protein [Clostridia bacterium]